MVETAFSAGEVLCGKYRVEGVIGRGGMGVVLRATHDRLGTRVAIKTLRPTTKDRREVLLRFAREARLAASIRSDHVVRVLDVEETEGGVPLLVMEHLEGEDLAARLARGGPLAVDVAVDFVLQACAGLGEAHARGIVHRDLKPSNMFLATRADGTEILKLLDFGISKPAPEDAEAPSLTATGAVCGSPLYMSPEQLMSARDVDPRSDVWALGVVLYELVTGRPPFAGESSNEISARVAAQPAPRLDAPAALADVVARCLEKDRERRVSDVVALARALQPFRRPGALGDAEVVERTALRARAAQGTAPPAVSGPARETAPRETTPRETAPPARVTRAPVREPEPASTDLSWQAHEPGRAPSGPPPSAPARGATSSSRRGLMLAGGALVVALGGGAVALATARGARPVAAPAAPPGQQPEASAGETAQASPVAPAEQAPAVDAGAPAASVPPTRAPAATRAPKRDPLDLKLK